MSPYLVILALLLLSIIAYHWGRKKAFTVVGGTENMKQLHSRPAYYGMLTAFWCGIPMLALLGGWYFTESSIVTHLVSARLPVEIRSLPEDRLGLVMNNVRALAEERESPGQFDDATRAAATHYRHLKETGTAAVFVVVVSAGMIGMIIAAGKITPALRARNHVESFIQLFLLGCSCIAVLTTIGIVLSVLYEAVRFFRAVPISEFLFGLRWSPQLAIRADQVGSSGAFGAIPVFSGTALISAIGMSVAVPIGLMSAIYLSEYAGRKFRTVAKPLMEILAGIPTVVYGYFAALTVAPFIRDAGSMVGLTVASESALAAGVVMGIMIIPFVSSISDDVINAVPQSLRDGSYGLGATKSETIKQVVLPAALPGIVGGILLAVSRAVGETMIVVMAAGLSANLTANPFKAVTTVTVQIVTLLVGDQEFDSPKTLAAFALGLLLFLVTLTLNIIALYVVRKYREQYE